MLRLAPFALLAVALVACDRDAPTKPIASAGKVVSQAEVPSEPTNLRVEAITDTSARVAWDAVEGATDYDVNYRTLSGRWTNEPHKGTRLYNTIYDLEPNTEYRWAVRAENSDGPSDWVFAENFTTLGATESSVTSANLELGGSVEGDRAALEALDRSANWLDERPHGGCRNDACKNAPLRNWFSSRSLRKWECVETNSEGRAVALDLPCGNSSHWYGTIPPEIGQLTHLESLRIRGEMHGPLPPEIGQLRNLRVLDIWARRLGYDRDHLISSWRADRDARDPPYGAQPIYEIPAGLGNLTNLEVLNLVSFSGAFAGEIPPELGNLTNLKVLSLGWEEGPAMPPELGKLVNLEKLWIASSGPLPPELGNLRNLRVLEAYSIDGPLPPQLGQLSQLDTLKLYGVRSGSIPPEFGNMTSLEILYISGFHEARLEPGDLRFGGPIPPELGNLINLEHLALANGDWEGPLPASLGQLTKLKSLGINGGGFISGTLPPEWGNMKALEALWLPSQEIEGSLPEEWAFMQSLQGLDLQDNFLEGPLPGIWGQMKNLRRFNLSLNFIDSSLPAGWSQMESLEKLAIVESGLTGPLPPEWSQLSSLIELNLENNEITGPLISTWSKLSNLEVLGLSDNQLEGPIPPQWNQFKSLKTLRLDNNQLSGLLPNLTGLENLKGISLSGNNFTPDVESQGCFSHRWYPWQLKVRTGTYRGQPTYRINVHGINLCPGNPPPESSSGYLLGG